ISDLEFEGGDALLQHALPMARRLAAFKRQARAAGVPAIYANDNFGRWKTDFSGLVRRCTRERVRGRPVARLLAPDHDRDYFVLRPKHPAVPATPPATPRTYRRAATLTL